MACCCVPFCKNRSNKNPEKLFSFFHFPSDRNLRKEWLVQIRRDIGPKFQITKNVRICSAHFRNDDMFSEKGRRKLIESAVPSIFSWTKTKKARRNKMLTSSHKIRVREDNDCLRSAGVYLTEGYGYCEVKGEVDTDEEEPIEEDMPASIPIGTRAVRNDFLESTAAVLMQYRVESFLCDTIVSVDDGELPAHSVILCAASPVVKTGIGTSPAPYRVHFPHVKKEIMELALNAIYTGYLERRKQISVRKLLDFMMVDTQIIECRDKPGSIQRKTGHHKFWPRSYNNIVTAVQSSDNSNPLLDDYNAVDDHTVILTSHLPQVNKSSTNRTCSPSGPTMVARTGTYKRSSSHEVAANQIGQTKAVVHDPILPTNDFLLPTNPEVSVSLDNQESVAEWTIPQNQSIVASDVVATNEAVSVKRIDTGAQDISVNWVVTNSCSTPIDRITQASKPAQVSSPIVLSGSRLPFNHTAKGGIVASSSPMVSILANPVSIASTFNEGLLMTGIETVAQNMQECWTGPMISRKPVARITPARKRALVASPMSLASSMLPAVNRMTYSGIAATSSRMVSVLANPVSVSNEQCVANSTCSCHSCQSKRETEHQKVQNVSKHSQNIVVYDSVGNKKIIYKSTVKNMLPKTERAASYSQDKQGVDRSTGPCNSSHPEKHEYQSVSKQPRNIVVYDFVEKLQMVYKSTGRCPCRKCVSGISETLGVQKVFHCDFCVFRTNKIELLYRHIRKVCKKLHTGGNKSSDNVSELINSEMDVDNYTGKFRHRDPRPDGKFQCEFCSEAFDDESKMFDHLAVHSRQKELRCDTCNKTFRTRTGLKMHRRLHTGETPELCPICGDKFSTSTLLNRHVAVTHNKTTYPPTMPSHKCLSCNAAFRKSSSLEYHMESVHGVSIAGVCNKAEISAGSQRVCEKCGATFSKQEFFDKHQRICKTVV